MVAKRWQMLQGYPSAPVDTEVVVKNQLINHLSF